MSVGDAIRLLDLKPQYQHLLRSDPALWDKAVSRRAARGHPLQRDRCRQGARGRHPSSGRRPPLTLGRRGSRPGGGLGGWAGAHRHRDDPGRPRRHRRLRVRAVRGGRRGAPRPRPVRRARARVGRRARRRHHPRPVPRHHPAGRRQRLAAARRRGRGRAARLPPPRPVGGARRPHARRALAAPAVRRAPPRRRRARPLRRERCARRPEHGCRGARRHADRRHHRGRRRA